MNSEVPARISVKLGACFTVGFALLLVLLHRLFYFTVGFNQRTESKSLMGFSPIDLVAAKFIWLKKACTPPPE